ncbi:MAG: hypothetical protein QF483_05445 [Gammaproteobacteria bacterium]|jgi:hypothetical protein|nr:hypothetical protein [Chromatiales bacterium]MCP4925543.1 hypothetical protein [Gammaproteobacteria bacterium]MDP7153874.1 hypothetical protein [Gammaproteobacteria bacterium]MDP7296550.1 hypothetical protein [Gammaproteobacteria bacterium]MDP7419306.1 hypothetical protein [Gammaproteobacteria bacterium]
MNDKESMNPVSHAAAVFRAPQTAGETLMANFKPQPAMPALIVFVLSVLLPAMSAGQNAVAGDGGSVFLLFIPVGIIVSCGLAIAAGFCSLFPQGAWIALAVWSLEFMQAESLPGYNRIVLLAGIFIVAVMFVVQVWRVKTGKFQPTIRIDVDD